jgi:acyl-CoA dehydrogenase
MSETRELLREAAERLLEKHCSAETMRRADAGEFPQALWRALEQAGYPAALVPESAGGAGLEMADALSLLVSAGRHALPAPLAETMLAGWLLSSAGIALPEGPLAVAPVRAGDTLRAKREGAAWKIEGKASRVPWAAQARAIAVLAQAGNDMLVALVAPADCRIGGGANVAGEPRDDVDFAGARCAAAAPTKLRSRDLLALGAVMRSAQMAGALQCILEASVRYAGERVQFGRPIGRFQAVQQNLAVLAGHAAAATAAAEAAIEAAAQDMDSLAASLPIAAAKIRSGEAAGIGAAIAHQVHGAIGFTQEHSLHYATRRLWSWRDEFGNEAYWSRRLGGDVAAAGADRLWQTITAAG